MFKKLANLIKKDSDTVTISWHIDEKWEPNVSLVNNITMKDKRDSLKFLLGDIISYTEMEKILERKNPCDAAFKFMRDYSILRLSCPIDRLTAVYLDNERIFMDIMLIQNTKSSLNTAIEFAFMAIVYDIMDCILYDAKNHRINNEYYRSFLLDLNNGFYQIHEDILTVILATQKRLGIDIETLIQRGMEFLKINSVRRGTVHANFILTIGIEHIEVMIRKIIQNLYESNEHFSESSILIKLPDTIDLNKVTKSNEKQAEKEEVKTLDTAQYKPIKGYFDTYLIKPIMYNYYTQIILQVNKPLLEVISKPEYKYFETTIKESNIIFDAKNEFMDFTHVVYTPFTKTGKNSKYPICCHYFIDTKSDKSLFVDEENVFGRLYLRQDGKIGKGDIILWKNHRALIIKFKDERGELVVSKIEQKN